MAITAKSLKTRRKSHNNLFGASITDSCERSPYGKQLYLTKLLQAITQKRFDRADIVRDVRLRDYTGVGQSGGRGRTYSFHFSNGEEA